MDRGIHGTKKNAAAALKRKMLPEKKKKVSFVPCKCASISLWEKLQLLGGTELAVDKQVEREGISRRMIDRFRYILLRFSIPVLVFWLRLRLGYVVLQYVFVITIFLTLKKLERTR